MKTKQIFKQAVLGVFATVAMSSCSSEDISNEDVSTDLVEISPIVSNAGGISGPSRLPIASHIEVTSAKSGRFAVVDKAFKRLVKTPGFADYAQKSYYNITVNHLNGNRYSVIFRFKDRFLLF